MAELQVVETEDVEAAVREHAAEPLPAALPVLPLREMVAYPDTLTPLAVGRERSKKLIDEVLVRRAVARPGRLPRPRGRGPEPRPAL